MVRVLASGPRVWVSIPGRDIRYTQNMLLDAYSLTLRTIRYGSRVVDQSRE